ncbi:MAG TPA: crosslink repair DNA glycosylase YcaQ family protein [Acidobacteriota bacterium]|nr:crosslink repair DNA glycosylase YcaQ family protein [Acidobacteriota bacterium]
MKLRAWWSHKQGLDGQLKGKSAAEVLEQTGWARSVGGANPYLTLFSRGGIDREEADKAVAKLEILELPSARGCTYVVASSDAALALRVGQGFGTAADMRTARKLGVTDDEIRALCAKVLDVLQQGSMSPDELRLRLGNYVRNLGAEGKKKGLTTTLPLALGQLQSAGEIRRIPMNGRLDQQRYEYAAWKPSPLADSELSDEQVYTDLARRFFKWIGPATSEEFQWFSGLGVRAAKAALEPLGLQGLSENPDFLMLPEDFDAFQSYQPPSEPQYALVSSLDAIMHLRRDVKGLVAPEDWNRQVFGEKGLTELGGLTDSPNHVILDRGRLIGLWEYDTASETLVWTTFVPRNADIEQAVKETESFVRDELGDARLFSLDSPKSREPRIAELRRMNAKGLAGGS